jgi:SAM-dependent methyltransferase
MASESNDVRAMYELYPYPLADHSAEPIYDVALALDLIVADLDGKEVLDAGCGTGHRLVGMALAHPDTSFVGVDFSDGSLAVGNALAEHHGCDNVEFRKAEIGGEHLGREFDVVTSTGVLHHLVDPAAGAAWVQEHLKPHGLSYTWHYHPHGEFDRLMGRQLARLLTGGQINDDSVAILVDLGLSLSAQQYGTRTSYSTTSNHEAIAADVDAFLHPIVNAYRFQEAADLFRDAADWVAVNGINWLGGSALVDLSDWTGTAPGVLGSEDVFASSRIRSRFDALGAKAKLECLELSLRPTGFTVVAGRTAALASGTDRLRGNAMCANLLSQAAEPLAVSVASAVARDRPR